MGGDGSGKLLIRNISAAYNISISDNNYILNCTANTFTITSDSCAILGSGFNVTIWNTSATVTHVITIDANLAETIDGKTTQTLRIGEGFQLVCDGTNFQTGTKKDMRGYAENIGSGANRPVASGASDLSIGEDTQATGGLSVALGYNAQTTAARSSSYGTNSGANGSRAATGSGAMALGGSYTSGSNAFSAAGADNSGTYGAQGANSVSLGQTSKASAANSTVNGLLGISSGTASTVSGGSTNTASGSYSTVPGGLQGLAAQYGKYAYASGLFSAQGDAQQGKIVLRGATTSATPLVLTSDSAAAATTNQCILSNNQAMAIRGQVICRESVAGADAATGWEFTAIIRRGANAAATALVAAVTPTLIASDAGLATASIAVTADTTNGGLAVTATGIAATNLHWVCTITSTETIYA